jgi:spore photoproduct lyase
MKYKIKQIFIDQASIKDKITHRIIRFFGNNKISIIKPDQKFKSFLKQLSFTEGKQTLWLTPFKGQFLRPCPGTSTMYLCCNYLILNEITNCPIDCTYCILQNYINSSAITIYTNTEKIIDEMIFLSRLNPERILRLGTGELSDSLALDPVTRMSEELIPAVQKLPNILLELKSKSDHIQHLLHLDPKKVILSWSMNPTKIIRTEEHKSATLTQRLEAAQSAVDQGFLIALHFDPVIHISKWEDSYHQLIHLIGQKIDPTKIAWISLGSLRYPPDLKETAQTRFTQTTIFTQEHITGKDGKIRYLKPIRKKMYQFIYQNIQKYLPGAFVYFCMESSDLWKEILGKQPVSKLEVDFYFATELFNKFPYLNLPEPKKQIYQNDIILANG